MRILIADDDPISRRFLERTLMRLGHDVVAVADGELAVEALLAKDAPRLAILDWMMPGADGLMVCQQVRGRAETYVYVILLTARDRHEDMVAALNAEVDDFLTKPVDSVELRARLRSGERVLALQDHLLETREALRHQATHDDLTGLWNRRRIVEELERELRRATGEQRPVSVALLDLDHFKQVNDTLGHAAGDAVLQQTAGRLTSVLRDYDAVGRYGGEEFLMVMPGCDGTAAALAATRSRLAICDTPMLIEGTPVSITASLGVAAFDGSQEAAATHLIATADAALYRAKAGGRNRVES